MSFVFTNQLIVTLYFSILYILFAESLCPSKDAPRSLFKRGTLTIGIVQKQTEEHHRRQPSSTHSEAQTFQQLCISFHVKAITVFRGSVCFWFPEMFHGRLCPAVSREHVPSRFGCFFQHLVASDFVQTTNCSKILCILVHECGAHFWYPWQSGPLCKTGLWEVHSA